MPQNFLLSLSVIVFALVEICENGPEWPKIIFSLKFPLIFAKQAIYLVNLSKVMLHGCFLI